MVVIIRKLKAFKFDRKAATAVEYGLIMALMTLALLGALSLLGSNTQDKWESVAESVSDAG